MAKSKASKSQASKSSGKSSANWRFTLSSQDINTVHPGRICETLVMAELTTKFSEIITKFQRVAYNNPASVCKSINYEDFVNDIKSVTEPKDKTKTNPWTPVRKLAITEALAYCSRGEIVPLQLTAHLLKLQIISLILEDVDLIEQQKKRDYDKLNPKLDKKDKAKKVIDKKSKTNTEARYPSSEIRTLYIVISGLYDPNVIEELYNVGISLAAILELATPDEVFEERRGTLDVLSKTSTSTISESLDVTGTELAIFVNREQSSEQSSFDSNFNSERESALKTTEDREMINMLYSFWNQIYSLLEGDLRAQYLENTAHIRISFCYDNFNNNGDGDSIEQDSKILTKMIEELKQISDFKEKHIQYLNYTKVYQIESNPIHINVDQLPLYNKILNVSPPDCFTIELLLHCLIEEVSSYDEIIDECEPDISTSITDLKPEFSKSKEIVSNELKEHPSVKIIDTPTIFEENPEYAYKNDADIKEVAGYVLQYRKKNWPHCRTTVLRHRFPTSKIDLKIRNKSFNIYENDEFSLKLNGYKQIASELLKINLDVLKICYPNILWLQYPHIESIQIVLKNQQLQTWSRLLSLSERDLKCAINALVFDTVSCSAPESSSFISTNSSYALFLPKNENNERTKLQVCVTYIPTPDNSSPLIDKEPEMKSESPAVSYSCLPNVFESKNIHTYKWYELLSPTVMLQELQKAFAYYACIDHKFCPFDDTILLRYHNNTDEFGINTRLWNQSLSTPVCFRDFCKYIIHEESEWLQKPNGISKTKASLSPESENLQSQSINATETSLRTSKRSCTKELKTETDLNLEEAVLKNKLFSLCAKPGEPYSFLSYDLNETRTQLTGGTISFLSLDGYKVTLDKTSFIGTPNNLSLNVTIRDHSFVLHCRETTPTKPLMFHFNLANDAVIAFEKPTMDRKRKINLVETAYENLKTKRAAVPNSAYKERERFYYVVERHRCVLKEINVAFSSKSSLILSENQMRLCLCHSKIPTTCPGNRNKNDENLEKRSTAAKCSSMFSLDFGNDVVPTSTKQPLLNVQGDLDQFKLNLSNVSYTLKNSNNNVTEKLIQERNAVLDAINKAKRYQVPLYSVLSSKLHKYAYMKRKKSKLYINTGKHKIVLSCKHPHYEIDRQVQLIKLFPVILNDTASYNNSHSYDMVMSLPSGLTVSTYYSYLNDSLIFKQGYIEKGPQCKPIINEYSRTYTRDGNIVIRKCDGTLEILCKDGVLVRCAIPYSRYKSHVKHILNEKQKTAQSFKLGTDAKNSTNRFFKKTSHYLKRWYRHLIGGRETRYFKRRRTHLLTNNILNNCQNQIYCIYQKNSCEYPLQFTIITKDGQMLYVTAEGIQQKGKIFQTTLKDDRYNDEFYIRDDGTKSLIDDNGIRVTQFLDQTRISSWCIDSSKLLYVEIEDHSVSEISLNSGSFRSFEILLPSNGKLKFEGWIVVDMFYKFEHPNYVTVVYNNLNSFAELTLPDNIAVTITDKGNYLVHMDSSTFTCINEESVYLEVVPCELCVQRSNVSVNVKPLYDEIFPIPETTELLKAYDSYEKIFFVGYNGNCFRNGNFVRHYANRARCKYHQQEETQKLFILNRDCSGKKLWDIKAHRRRLTQARNAKNTTLQYYNKNSERDSDYSSLEVRTYEFKPFHKRYMMSYVVPDISLMMRKYSELDPPRLAYTKTLHLYCMPEVHLLQPFQKEIVHVCDNMGVSKSSGPYVTQFINNLIENYKCACCGNSLSEVCPSGTSFSSAASQCERWYKQYHSSKGSEIWQRGSFCSCNVCRKGIKTEGIEEQSAIAQYRTVGEEEQIEIVPRKLSSDSMDFGSCKKRSSIFCRCQQPTQLLCRCKTKKYNTPCSSTISVVEEEKRQSEEKVSGNAYLCKCNPFSVKNVPKEKDIYKENLSDDDKMAEEEQTVDTPSTWKYLMKQLLQIIVDLIMNSKNSEQFDGNENKKYKISMASVVISDVLKGHFNSTQISWFLKRLERLQMDQNKTNLLCDDLSKTILSEMPPLFQNGQFQ